MSTSTSTRTTTILVPLDGSTTAETALRPAFAMAERAGAEVQVLGVGNDDELATYLEGAVRRFADSAPTSATVTDGKPADRILELAARPGTVVCIASHGRTGLSRLVLGSVAEEVVRESPAPTVVVGPNAASVPLRSERAHLVVCVDGSDRAHAVLAPVVALVRAFDLTCEVVHAAPPDEDVSLDLLPAPEPIREQAERICEEFADELRDAGVDATWQVLFGDPTTMVAGHARTTHASLVAVATHGRTGLARAALGSTAADIVRHSPCPVLVVPSR